MNAPANTSPQKVPIMPVPKNPGVEERAPSAVQNLARKLDWLVECIYLLWAGWWPVRLAAGVRWRLVERNVTYHYTRHNAWLKAKDRMRYARELQKQLLVARRYLAETRAILDNPENYFGEEARAADLLERIEAFLRPAKQTKA